MLPGIPAISPPLGAGADIGGGAITGGAAIGGGAITGGGAACRAVAITGGRADGLRTGLSHATTRNQGCRCISDRASANSATAASARAQRIAADGRFFDSRSQFAASARTCSVDHAGSPRCSRFVGDVSSLASGDDVTVVVAGAGLSARYGAVVGDHPDTTRRLCRPGLRHRRSAAAAGALRRHRAAASARRSAACRHRAQPAPCGEPVRAWQRRRQRCHTDTWRSSSRRRSKSRPGSISRAAARRGHSRACVQHEPLREPFQPTARSHAADDGHAAPARELPS